jgi:hypothetical protein
VDAITDNIYLLCIIAGFRVKLLPFKRMSISLMINWWSFIPGYTDGGKQTELKIKSPGRTGFETSLV